MFDVSLFAQRLRSAELTADLLAPLGVSDPGWAARRLQSIASSPSGGEALALLFPHLIRSLAGAASVDRALTNLDRLAQAAAEGSTVLRQLANDSRLLDTVVALFSGSQYLADILLRHPEQLALLADREAMGRIKPLAQFHNEAFAAMRRQDRAHGGDLASLRRYHQAELLRIGAGDLSGLLDLGAVTAQLSDLAQAVIQTTLELLATQLGATTDGFCVLAMGKLGGGELNYSSDVDLVFLAESGNGEEAARVCQRLGAELIAALTGATEEGFLYRVDMRLRPWGRVGPLISTVEGHLTYLARHARLWEKQALLKARAVAGDHEVGARFLQCAQALMFASGPEEVRADVREMKERTEAQLRRLGRLWGEVKLGEGSIRDAEFVAQYLQLAHGGAHPELRSGNTLDALSRLAAKGLLSAEEHRLLAEGYTFLRTVEHYLQILDYRQTHALPSDAADLRCLARRLGFLGPDAGARLVSRFDQHSAAVRSVYLRHLAGPPAVPDPAGADPTIAGTQTGEAAVMLENPTALSAAAREHMARLAPSYAATFDPVEVERHAVLAARLDAGTPVVVDAEPLDGGQWRVTIVGYDYLGELSLICGLLFAYGFSIIDGHVYTYEPGGKPDARRKIVDVFNVHMVPGTGEENVTPDLWHRYAADLLALVRHLQARQPRSAQGELAKRVAEMVRTSPAAPALPPVDIEIDNEASAAYTVLHISAADTPGFLYEFTNALALSGVHIAQVFVISAGRRVHDTLFVTDARGDKIVSPDRQRELRAATVLIKHFTHLLPRSPNPESALLHFHEYLGELFGRSSWPDELASLERPEVLDALARLLGVSEFLWDDFLRMQYANLFPVVRDIDALATAKSRVQLAEELERALGQPADADGWRSRLNAFKDREMFRIDMRHILGHLHDFGEFSVELGSLVEAVVTATASRAWQELVSQHGEPRNEEGGPIALAVCVLGKCGGFELGYASDIEVMFVYSEGGNTSGSRPVAASEFFDKLVSEFGRAIWARREGIFEIDLELRPYGKAGSLAVSLDAFRRYFAPTGPAWAYERQALIKLRAIAGDPALGRQVEELRDAYVYAPGSFDASAMRAMRERQMRHLVVPGSFNAKYSLGGLVDVEYVVQGLQMMHGATRPGLRLTNTRGAIAALADHGVLSEENAHRLREAHLFLQQLINALRVVRGNSKDLTVPPEGSEEFAFLARRLGYEREPARLSAALSDHTAWVQRLGTRLLG